ncbi:MAG TPA: zf-HC2 domain-containing protein [Casimicrobiaceae bacterium]|nr:zf-HC2 domain-containing protein [Casimicrobiaceae bacterium]
MSGKILRLDDSAHRRVDAVLPWFVNGTLGGDELAGVERHLRECGRCRREVALLKEVQTVCAAAELVPDAMPGYRRLSERISGGRRIGALADRLRSFRLQWQRAPHWARWTIVGEFAAIVAVSLWVRPLDSNSGEVYETLGSPVMRSASVGTIAVVFRPEARESDLRRIVQAAGARLVDGPTETNAYVLRVPAGRRKEALAALRAAPAVVLAEPLTRPSDQ